MRSLLNYRPLALALIALSSPLLAAEPAAKPADPRPTLLIIGDASVLPFGNGASWPQLLQRSHPDWNIVVNGDAKRTIPDLAAGMDTILKSAPRSEIVLLLIGVNDAAADAYAKNDATKLAAALASAVAKIKASPATSKATIVLATPLPVIDARLDQWSKERFKGGEANSDAIADAIRKVASESGAALVDFHKWSKDDVADGKPGRLVGSIGHLMREWGHPIAATYFDEQLKKLNPQPADPAAFANWKAEYESSLILQNILATTSEGLVAHGEPIAAVPTSGKTAAFEIKLPESAIVGGQLNILFTSGTKPYAAIGNAGNRPFAQTSLVLNADGTEVTILLKGSDWQLIDEAQPNRAIDSVSYRANIQKMNYFGLTSNEEGSRRWMLARFDLASVADKKITAAKIVIGATPTVEKFTPPDKSEAVDSSKLGAPAAALVTGQDALWDDAKATWKSRDGKIGWSGGKVDVAKRKQALEDFLKTNPPKKIADEASAELAKLK